MDNPETLSTLVTQNTRRRQTKQKNTTQNNISLSQIVSQEKHNSECEKINSTNIRKV
jgi:hypothetical protein